ncbi:DgyrCDS2963 [Dimorphilus gyrociliatus]|uniref:DgyrCDS2963 n=1 Tax=Dimorphilus gyrociliatus TaxID=2664684 RepID=A0A7I8VBS4_9ANNE|nr:DgyrCDS2963 [Dimorphilus gyrociliatus]
MFSDNSDSHPGSNQGRRKIQSRDKQHKVSGLVTRLHSGFSKKKPSNTQNHQPLSSDSEYDTDLEEETKVHNDLHDHQALAKNIYFRQCSKIGVTPISYFLRHAGDDQISLRDHYFGPRGAKAIAAPLRVNNTLTKLDFSYNGMGDEGVEHLCYQLVDNIYVFDLNLAYNDISHKGFKTVGSMLLTNQIIKNLDVSGNQLGNRSGKILLSLLQKNNTLLKLGLSRCDLGLEATQSLANALVNNTSLQKLDISWNQIVGKAASVLAKCLSENEKIDELNLSWNGFGERKAAEDLGKALAENNCIGTIDLRANRFVDLTLAIFSSFSMTKNEHIKILKLSKNPFTHVGSFALLQNISKNSDSSISSLDLQGITVKKNFIDLLENLEDKGKKINCTYQTYIHSKKLKPGKAVEILCQIIHMKDKTPFSLFGIASDQSVTVIDKKSFEDAIKVNAGIDLTDQEWFTLFDDLTNKDGQIELASLYTKWREKYEKKDK